MKPSYALTLSLMLTLVSLPAVAFNSVEELGQALYFDVNLSKNRTQSCSTCHSPEAGFSDPRPNASGKAFSLGDDGTSLGDRNAPTASYASLIPPFHKKKNGQYAGGQFWDGREQNLARQSGGPPLNPIEMGMSNKESVVKRLQENSAYIAAFQKFFGKGAFKNNDTAYTAMTQSIAAFEKTDFFSPFDSKYDRHLRGEYQMTAQEELGMTLFFSQQFTNCNICHQLKTIPESEGETFSNYEYHNIGVPTNTKGRQANGVAIETRDDGLLNNPTINDHQQAGKFKTPTLRNIAVTSPYMHNGTFEELKTVILFYNKYNSKSAKRQINPETGEKWKRPEVNENISFEELETGPALNNKRIDALVAFLKTLTDKRYEHLVK